MRRNESWLKRFQWNVGALVLKPIDHENLSEDEIKLEMKNRKSLGAKHVHKIRKDETEAKIRSACESLLFNGKRLTRKNIVTVTGLSISTVNRNRHLIDYFKNNNSV